MKRKRRKGFKSFIKKEANKNKIILGEKGKVEQANVKQIKQEEKRENELTKKEEKKIENNKLEIKINEEEKLKEISKKDDENARKKLNNLISVSKNAKFVTLALVTYFIKKLYFGVKDSNDDNFNLPILKGNLSLDYPEDDYGEKLNYLFSYIIDRLSMIYNTNEVNLKLTSHSNFFKTDKNYTEIIVPEFDKILDDQYDKEKILDNIKIFDGKTNTKERVGV